MNSALWECLCYYQTMLALPQLFLLKGFNGYSYTNNSARELAKKMKVIEASTPEKLEAMQEASHLLSKRISVKTSAANFISIIR